MELLIRLRYFFWLTLLSLFLTSSCADEADFRETNPSQDPNPTPPKEDPFKKVIFESKEFGRGENYWWPQQKIPEAIIICEVANSNYQERILAESLSGIAAKSVNEGRGDELVWIAGGPPALTHWLERTKVRLGISQTKSMNVWQLLDYLKGKGLVRGYVVYDYDNGTGGMYTKRSDMDNSANKATAVGGVMNAAVVSRSLESKMVDAQLTNLFDAANDVTYREIYDHLKDAINPYLITMVDPKVPNHRDIAIAHNSMVFDSSSDADMDYFFGKTKLSSPVLGWGFGDEYNFTSRASMTGMFTTASNWCWNLPVLSAGSHEYQTKQVKSLHPKNIEWDKGGHFHSFIMSDGDNMQWMELNFTHNDYYWANSNNGAFPFGWTTCGGQMTEMLPTTFDYIVETQPNNVSIIDYGGGYHYPDLLGGRINRELAIRTHARKVNAHMKRTGIKVFGFICKDLDSEEAKAAYQIYAQEIQDLTGMIAVQFNPYEGGNGEIHWATDSNGRHIPIVTTKYSLWANLNNERAGGPDKIANLVNQEVVEAAASGTVANSLTMVHAWSEFASENGLTARGLTPVRWTVDKLSETVTVINTEEMLWRVRMTDYPDEVYQIINKQ